LWVLNIFTVIFACTEHMKRGSRMDTPAYFIFHGRSDAAPRKAEQGACAWVQHPLATQRSCFPWVQLTKMENIIYQKCGCFSHSQKLRIKILFHNVRWPKSAGCLRTCRQKAELTRVLGFFRSNLVDLLLLSARCTSCELCYYMLGPWDRLLCKCKLFN